MATTSKEAWCTECGWVHIPAYNLPASSMDCPECKKRTLLSPSVAWKAHKITDKEYERHKNLAHHPSWMRRSQNE